MRRSIGDVDQAARVRESASVEKITVLTLNDISIWAIRDPATGYPRTRRRAIEARSLQFK